MVHHSAATPEDSYLFNSQTALDVCWATTQAKALLPFSGATMQAWAPHMRSFSHHLLTKIPEG